jgi:hypothetical protein
MCNQGWVLELICNHSLYTATQVSSLQLAFFEIFEGS